MVAIAWKLYFKVEYPIIIAIIKYATKKQFTFLTCVEKCWNVLEGNVAPEAFYTSIQMGSAFFACFVHVYHVLYFALSN